MALGAGGREDAQLCDGHRQHGGIRILDGVELLQRATRSFDSRPVIGFKLVEDVSGVRRLDDSAGHVKREVSLRSVQISRTASLDRACERPPRDVDLAVLRRYLKLGGNKAALAQELHLSRPALYKRRAVLGDLLAADLSDADSMASLYVALLIIDAQRRADGVGDAGSVPG